MLIYENIDLWAKKSPDKICLIHGENKVSYKELSSLTDSIAKGLYLKSDEGKKIIINLANPLQSLLYFLGASKAGFSSVLTTGKNPDIEILISMVNPSLIIDSNFKLPDLSSTKLPKVTKESLFLGALSSGSTGIPKIIWRDHMSWTSAFSSQSEVFQLGSNDILFLAGSLAYTGNLNSLLHILHEGGTVFLSTSIHPRRWYKEIIENNITSIFMVPANYRILVRSLNSVIENVTTMVSAGSKMDLDTVKKINSYFPAAKFYEYYGASELGHVSFSTAEDLIRKPDSVGKAFPNVEIYIKENLIKIKSPYLAPDYRPLSSVGDLGKLDDDGYLYLLGRIDNVINSGGIKIIPEQIENIINKCPGVEESIVKGIDDPIRGKKIGLWIVRSNPFLSQKDIRAFCNKNLPKSSYPYQINFIEKIPLNQNGKIDRNANLTITN